MPRKLDEEDSLLPTYNGADQSFKTQAETLDLRQLRVEVEIRENSMSSFVSGSHGIEPIEEELEFLRELVTKRGARGEVKKEASEA